MIKKSLVSVYNLLVAVSSFVYPYLKDKLIRSNQMGVWGPYPMILHRSNDIVQTNYWRSLFTYKKHTFKSD